jgi:hypothetical protein
MKNYLVIAVLSTSTMLASLPAFAFENSANMPDKFVGQWFNKNWDRLTIDREHTPGSGKLIFADGSQCNLGEHVNAVTWSASCADDRGYQSLLVLSYIPDEHSLHVIAKDIDDVFCKQSPCATQLLKPRR